MSEYDEISGVRLPDGGDEPEVEQGYNYPTLYIDGTAHISDDPEELERVQIEFDAASNGVQSEADEQAVLGWVNSAAITLDRQDDAVHVSISVGDPRGAFVFTIRRLADERLIMHVPYPGQGMLHEKLTELHPGTFKIGREA